MARVFGPSEGIVWDDAALARFLAAPDGPVIADLMRRGQNVESQAKLNASGASPLEGAVNPTFRGPRVDTGRLRSSISHAPGRDANGIPYVDVGTNVFYARHLELGFTSRAGNFFRYPFLVPALPAAAL